MRLTVFGASGGVGRHIVRLAGEEGHSVRGAYRSPPAHRPPSHVEIVVAPNLLDLGAVAEAVAGTDAVVSALGLRRAHPRNPFSRLVSPPDFTSRFAELLAQVLQGVDTPRRVVAISAAGVGESWRRMSWPLRLLFRLSNVGVAYEDLARMEAAFVASDLDWTCVRPATLTDGPLTKEIRFTDRYTLISRISRADVAWFMLEAAKESGHDALRTPMIKH